MIYFIGQLNLSDVPINPVIESILNMILRTLCLLKRPMPVQKTLGFSTPLLKAGKCFTDAVKLQLCKIDKSPMSRNIIDPDHGRCSLSYVQSKYHAKVNCPLTGILETEDHHRATNDRLQQIKM